MKIYWERLIPFLFILSISFLAARYLGGAYYILFRAILFLLILDVTVYLISFSGMRYNQNFSQEHLIRGESIHYEFYLIQSLRLPSHRIHIEFFPFNNPEMTDLAPLAFNLKARHKKKFNYAIQGGTRGIYRIGIRKMHMEDVLGLFAFPLPRYNRTFYIYPRLYRGSSYPLKEIKGTGETLLEKSRSAGDSTFSNLREYRPGLSLHAISWKHFARFTFPVIREQDNTVRPGRIIAMDRRSLGDERTREDGVLETTLALIMRILSGGEAVLLRGILPGKALEITNEAALDSFYQATLSMAFDDPLPPWYEETFEPLTLVSALPDDRLLEESFWQARPEWQMAAVLEGMGEEARDRLRPRLDELIRKGAKITVIERGDEFWKES